MRRLLRGGRQALADYLAARLWQSLVAFGAAHDPFAHHAGEEEPRQRPGGPPPAHPERLREDVPLSEQEQRIQRELWPACHPEHRTPDGG